MHLTSWFRFYVPSICCLGFTTLFLSGTTTRCLHVYYLYLGLRTYYLPFGFVHPLSFIWVFYRPCSLVLGLRTSYLSLGLMHPRCAFRFTHPQFYFIPFTTCYLPPAIYLGLPPTFTWVHTRHPLFGLTQPRIILIMCYYPCRVHTLLCFDLNLCTLISWLGLHIHHFYPVSRTHYLLPFFTHPWFIGICTDYYSYPSLGSPGTVTWVYMPAILRLVEGLTNLYLGHIPACRSTHPRCLVCMPS